MHIRIPSLAVTTLTLVVVAVFALLLSGCAASQPHQQPQSGTAEENASPDLAAGGTRLAPGLYDMPDGTVQAVGTLERSDLEGGFWMVAGGTASEGNEGVTVVVIANGDDLAAELEPLEGKTVMAVGKRQEGASIRMAGPEMVAETIEELSDTGSPAQ